jgi:Asp-tRNA(Asn)/Glu-tRNA(Gln) amidotransferase A subunit family amidase
VKPGSEQRALLANSAAALRAAGATVKDIALPAQFADAQRVHRTIMLYEGAQALGDLHRRERDKMSAKLNAGLDAGHLISEADYLQALDARAAMIAQIPLLFDGVDAIASPPAAGGAPGGISDTGDPSFCTFWSLLGAPAIVLPTGWSKSGMPMGMQLTAPLGNDAALLDAASWCEDCLFPVYAAGAAGARGRKQHAPA